MLFNSSLLIHYLASYVALAISDYEKKGHFKLNSSKSHLINTIAAVAIEICNYVASYSYKVM